MQDFVSGKTFVRPDLVAALDCGFKFYPEWKGALEVILTFKDCPLIFTEFNLGDLDDDLAVVREAAAATSRELQLCLPPQKNPFCSSKPSRCSDKSGNYRPFSVVYTNDYIAVVKST